MFRDTIPAVRGARAAGLLIATFCLANVASAATPQSHFVNPLALREGPALVITGGVVDVPPGSVVVIGGTPGRLVAVVPVDSGGQFSATLPVPPEDGGITISIVLPDGVIIETVLVNYN